MTTAYYFKVFGTLCVVVLILMVCLRLARKFQQKRFSQEIKLLDRFPIDQGASLVIVEIRKQKYLIGVGSKPITVLDRLDT